MRIRSYTGIGPPQIVSWAHLDAIRVSDSWAHPKIGNLKIGWGLSKKSPKNSILQTANSDMHGWGGVLMCEGHENLIFTAGWFPYSLNGFLETSSALKHRDRLDHLVKKYSAGLKVKPNKSVTTSVQCGTVPSSHALV